MKSVFERIVNLDEVRDIPLSEYSPKELCAFILRTYPNDPVGAIKLMRENLEVGDILGNQTQLLLEGYINVNRNETINGVS